MKPKDTESPTAPNGGADPADAAERERGCRAVSRGGAGLDPVAVLEAERTDLKDKLLRTLADMENLRRRTEREVADARSYAVTNFARDMLNVADNVRRALESVPGEAASSAEGAFKALIEGIELTERDLLKTLERHGVKKLEPHGREIRSAPPSGDVRGAEPRGPERHGRPGRAVGLRDRRARPAPGPRRRRQGRTQDGQNGAAADADSSSTAP